MTREEAIKTLKENYCAMCAYGSQDMDSCDIRSCDNKDAIKALEQETCEDAISRQEVQTELKNCEVVDIYDENDNFVGYYNADTVDSIVRNLPPVTPQLPKINGRKFEEIVVQYPPAELCTYPEYRGKPYFSIKYEENGKHIIGFGTYNPEVLSRYLREYFIAPTPIIEADK